MQLQINDNWRISTDPQNFILEKQMTAGNEAKEPGKITWKPAGFYTTLGHLLSGLLKKELLESDVSAIKELKAFISGVQDDIDGVGETLALRKTIF